MTQTRDLTGQRFGWLTVVRRQGASPHGNATWLCRCGCGQETTVPTDRLAGGNTTSCGCRRYQKGSRWRGVSTRSGRLTQALFQGRADAVVHRVRWECCVVKRGDGWKCNNNLTPFYARKFHALHPQHSGFFRLRASVADAA